MTLGNGLALVASKACFLPSGRSGSVIWARFSGMLYLKQHKMFFSLFFLYLGLDPGRDGQAINGRLCFRPRETTP